MSQSGFSNVLKVRNTEFHRADLLGLREFKRGCLWLEADESQESSLDWTKTGRVGACAPSGTIAFFARRGQLMSKESLVSHVSQTGFPPGGDITHGLAGLL